MTYLEQEIMSLNRAIHVRNRLVPLGCTRARIVKQVEESNDAHLLICGESEALCVLHEIFTKRIQQKYDTLRLCPAGIDAPEIKDIKNSTG
jgi:hypothetical protein